MLANPKTEISGMVADGTWIRVTGKLARDDRDEARAAMLAANKGLKRMDMKTLSTIIGHVSAKTTLNTYTHVTDAMRQTEAAKIDRGIGKCEPQDKPGSDIEGVPTRAAETRRKPVFEPYKGVSASDKM